MKHSIFLALVALTAAVLAYRYWFAATHGSLSVSVDDTSDPGRPRLVDEVEVTFMDAAGNVLAQASSLPPYHAIAITSPPAYSCRDVEQQAASSRSAREEWDRCFERQSRWIPTWIEDVAAVNLRSGSCEVSRRPIRFSTYGGEWWMWWVPLPHIGGKPYTLFSAYFQLDLNRCV